MQLQEPPLALIDNAAIVPAGGCIYAPTTGTDKPTTPDGLTDLPRGTA